MLLDFEDIIDMPVETQSGDQLGKVDGLILDIETHIIYQYTVKPTGISHLFDKQELLIGRNQVVSISKDKMTVYDGTYTEPSQKKVLVKTGY
jgi:sporulation protein YlmC with PRC-barrel domain